MLWSPSVGRLQYHHCCSLTSARNWNALPFMNFIWFIWTDMRSLTHYDTWHLHTFRADSGPTDAPVSNLHVPDSHEGNFTDVSERRRRKVWMFWLKQEFVCPKQHAVWMKIDRGESAQVKRRTCAEVWEASAHQGWLTPKPDFEADPGWTLFQHQQTPTAKKRARNLRSRCNAGFARCSQAVRTPGGCSKTTLRNHSELSERTHGRLLPSVNQPAVTAPQLPTTLSINPWGQTYPGGGPMSRSIPIPAHRRRQAAPRQRTGAARRSIPADTHHTHHITDGGDVSDSHLGYSVPLAAIFMK